MRIEDSSSENWRCVVASPQKGTYHLSLCATGRIHGKRRNEDSANHHKGCTQRTAHAFYHMDNTSMPCSVATIHIDGQPLRSGYWCWWLLRRVWYDYLLGSMVPDPKKRSITMLTI